MRLAVIPAFTRPIIRGSSELFQLFGGSFAPGLSAGGARIFTLGRCFVYERAKQKGRNPGFSSRKNGKVLLSLSILCITLALCQAACFVQLAETGNGLQIPQDSCTDLYDGRRHPSGSQWNTEHCMTCSCSGGELQCCDRYGGIAIAPKGCRAVVNPETCEYEYYKTDNPSEPCF